MSYVPAPIDTSHVHVSQEIRALSEDLARNTHELWAKQRMRDGWRYGPKRDDDRKEHPMLRPYDELPESEKVYDRVVSMETVKAILAMGFAIERPGGASWGADA